MSNIVRFPVTAVGRGKSASLWGKSLEDFKDADSSLGTKIELDFHSVAGWTVASLTDGEVATFAKIAAHGGVGELATPLADDAEGGQALYGLGSIASIRGRRVVFETLITLTTVPTFAVGLFESTGTTDNVLVAGTGVRNTTKDFIGFYRLDSGAVIFVSNNGGTGGTEKTVEIVAVGSTPADGTQIKVGFAINADGSVDISYNGVLKTTEAATITIASLPDGVLTPCYVALSANAGSAYNVSLKTDELNVFASA